MLKELILSVISGVIVALILQLFGAGRRRETAPRQSMRNVRYETPRRRSFLGRLVRLVLAVGGGLVFAQAAAPFVMRRLAAFDDGERFERFERFDRFERLDGVDGVAVHWPVIALTVIGTIVVYMLLSALTRRY